MAWQDELRRLDEELASGRISADDYRSRRDQIMASAVSPTNQVPGPASSESTTVMPPVQPPVPPAQGPGGTDDGDRTQIVSGQQMDSDRTQSVGWRATPPDDPNRTQVVPGVPPQAFAGGRGPRPAPGPQGFQQTPPPWENEEPLAAPWAGQEFPPMGANTPDWTLQGPEVFESDKKSSKGKVIGIIAIVVVLIGIAAGAYFIFKPKDTQQAGGTGGDETSSSRPATTTTSAKPKGPIADLPGDVSDTKNVKTFEDVVNLHYLTNEETGVYQQGQAGKSTIALAKDGDIQIVVLVTEQADEQAAATVAQGLDQIQQQFNHMTARPSTPAGVFASANEQASRGPIIRAHYASGKSVVRVQVQGPDLAKVNDEFEQILSDQLDRLKANG